MVYFNIFKRVKLNEEEKIQFGFYIKYLIYKI